MKITPSSFEPPWQPKSIVGNTAYYYNPETGGTRSEFVANNKLSERKKEFADWFKVHRKFRVGAVLIPRGEYVKMSRDPLAPFDFSSISKREGMVTDVLAANRVIIDGKYSVTVQGIDIPSKRNNPTEWNKAKEFTKSLVLGKKVFISINTNDPYSPNGDIQASSLDFDMPMQNQQEQEWGVFDYLNLSGYGVGAVARNIEGYLQTGTYGTATVGDRYSLSDTFTFTRLYSELTGKARPLSLTGRDETEGGWYEKLIIDTVFDPVNYISVGGKGISLFGKRLLRGERYMRRLAKVKLRTVRWANTFGHHVNLFGGGSVLDEFNRGWRRVNMLLEPAYYVINTQLDVVNSVYHGGMNPVRYLDIDPILKQADNPIFRKNIALKVAGKPNGGYTAQELKAFMKEYGIIGKSAGIGDVANNPYTRANLWDKGWEPMVKAAMWQSDRTRGALFIDGLKKGLDPDKAAARVNKYLFDYDPKHLTAFEQAYLNRIIPFYIPQTRNIALQVTQALEKPYKFTSIAKWQIQQREFAGQDQFKDYDKNTILQKVGEGRYIKLRFPTEDITQIPMKYGSFRKAFLASTYPTINIFPELFENVNYFDETKPSGNYPKYLAKKFISREYYAWRDFTNPNIPTSEFLSKHILGVSFITPNNRMNYQQALIDAGFSPTQAMQEAANTLKRQEYFKANAKRAVAKAQAESVLPPHLQSRPVGKIDKLAEAEGRLGWVEGGFWEKFQFPQFAITAEVANAAVLVQTGKWGNKGMLDRIPPSQLFRQFDIWQTGGRAYTQNDVIKEFRNARDFLADFILDPLWAVNWRTKAGKIIFTSKGEKVLSKEGRAIYAKLNPIVASGRAAGLYGKAAAIRMEIEANARFVKYGLDNPSIAGRIMYSPGLRVFGKTLLSYNDLRRTQILLQPLTSQLAKVKSAITKEIKEVMAPIGKAIEKHAGASEQLRLKWKDEFQKRFDVYDTNLKLLIKNARIGLDELESDAKTKMQVWEGAKRAFKADPSHGYFWHHNKLSQEAGTKITNFIELGKKNMNAQGVIDDYIREFDQMAMEAIPRGILKQTRMNYVGHIMTAKYKTLQGYTEPITGRLRIRAPWAKHRWNEGTIAEFNADAQKKYHFDMFEANIFRILKIRKPQHIEAVETYDFLRRIAEEQGISKVWAPFLKNTYGISSIPMVQDVLLPIETIRAMERMHILRNRVATVYTKPGILTRGLGAYDDMVLFYKKNILGFNPGFVPQNTISSLHQNIQAGYLGGYMPQDGVKVFGKTVVPMSASRTKGIAFVTDDGRPIYNWELNQWEMEDKIIGQPGRHMVGQRTPEMTNLIDKATNAPGWTTTQVENLVRRRLYWTKIKEGMTHGEAKKYVEAYHLQYHEKFSAAMEVAARFIMFPTWVTGAPFIMARGMVERPALYSTVPKVMDAWNSPSDKMLLRYQPEWMKSRDWYKVPNTDDAFFSPSFSTGELTQYPIIFHTKEFQFYWDEAKANPNILQRFARRTLDVDWLKRGGGSVKTVGDSIIITYRLTGETIIAKPSANNTIQFISGNGNVVIKEFETIGIGNEKALMVQGEPLNELARKNAFPWISEPILYAMNSQKYKLPDTGNLATDALFFMARLLGFGAISGSIEQAIDPDTPTWAKIINIFRVGRVEFGHEFPGLEAPQIPLKNVIRASHRGIRKNIHGCGY